MLLSHDFDMKDIQFSQNLHSYVFKKEITTKNSPMLIKILRQSQVEDLITSL